MFSPPELNIQPAACPDETPSAATTALTRWRRVYLIGAICWAHLASVDDTAGGGACRSRVRGLVRGDGVPDTHEYP